jgi:hypothetical protein
MKTTGAVRPLGVLIALAALAAPSARSGLCADLPRPTRRALLTRVDPAEAVKLRQRGLVAALLTSDPNRILAFYAVPYRHRDGTTRRDLRPIMERYFRDYRLVRIEPLRERYAVNVSGTQVTQTLQVRIRQQERETGRQEMLEAVALVEWSWQSGAWLITREQDGEAAGAAGLRSPANQKNGAQ